MLILDWFQYYIGLIPILWSTYITHIVFIGTDIFSTSTDGQVLWWDTRKLVEPVESLTLEYPGYKPGVILGGITLEYESTMVHPLLISTIIIMFIIILCLANQVYGGNRTGNNSFWESKREDTSR